MGADLDPYFKLKPICETPEEEICRCVERGALMLRDSLGVNPIYCVECNGEVPPETIGFDAVLAEEIAKWRSVSSSLYRLWLDSGEYEEWARKQLLYPMGTVNIMGMSIVEKLNKYVPTFYWWFADDYDENHISPMTCPRCDGKVSKYEERDFVVCEECRIFA